MIPEIHELIVQCQEAKRACKEQEKKMREPQFNGRYAPKHQRLLKDWNNAERALLKEIYK